MNKIYSHCYCANFINECCNNIACSFLQKLFAGKHKAKHRCCHNQISCTSNCTNKCLICNIIHLRNIYCAQGCSRQTHHPGQVICLYGNLGVGKTVFTKGLADGLGITEPIQSPTFTIVREYEEGRLPLYHFDVYRIGDIEEMDEIGYEDYVYGEGVCLIEWANLIEEILPDHYQKITIRKDLEKGFDYREIEMEEQ